MSPNDTNAPERIQPPPSRSRRALRLAVAFLLLVYFLAGIGFLVMRHWVWPRVDQWRPVIEARLSSEIGAPIRLGRLHADFDRLRPRLLVDGAEIGHVDEGEAGLRLDRIEALVSWRSLLAMKPLFELLRIEAPRLEIARIDDTRFTISGLVLDISASTRDTGDETRAGAALADWLVAQRSIRIQGASLRYTDLRSTAAAEFTEVDIAVDSTGRRHRMRASGSGEPSPAGKALAPIGGFELIADLERAGDAAQGASWTGQAYASFEDADVLAINALAAIRSPLAGGRGRGRLWFELAAGRLAEAHGEIDLAAPVLRTADGVGRLDVLGGHIGARWLDDGGIEITTEGVELVDSSGVAIDAAAGRQALVLDADWRLDSARIGLSAAEASDLLQLARAMPLPAALAERIARWRVDGRIDGAKLDWRATGEAPQYTIDVEFSDLALMLGGTPRGGDVPGVRGLSGTARLDPEGGRLALVGGEAVLRLPGVLEQADIGLDRYDAQVDWRRDADGELEVSIERFGFANADAAGELHGSWRMASRGPGIVDLEGTLDRADGTRVWRYLPLRLNGPARRWVRSAIRAGDAREVRMRLRGDLLDFPFVDPDRGEFLVTAEVGSGQLHYDEAWPAIEAAEASLRFERAAMSVAAHSARIFDVELGEVVARIDDLEHAVLHVDGKAEGPVADMIRVLRESPLRERLGEGLDRLRFDGPGSAVLRLELPIADIDASKVEGSVHLAGNRFEPLPVLPAFERVRGKLDFTRDGVAFEGLRADWLGGELVASGSSADDVLTIRGGGRATGSGLAAFIPPRFLEGLSGGFDYRGEVRVDHQGATVGVASDLVGLGSELPAPLAKSAQSVRPTRLEVAPADGGERIRLRIGADGAGGADGVPGVVGASGTDVIELLVDTLADAPRPQDGVRRAALGVGVEPDLPDSGFALRLRQPELDLDRWRGLLAADTKRAPGPYALPDPDRMSLRVDVARIGGKTIEDLEVEANHRDDAWTARVHSRQADGRIEWHDAVDAGPAGALVARFSRLEIPESDKGDIGSLLDEAPRTLPALDVRADRFMIGAMDLGALELSARQEGQGRRSDWLIDRLVLEHAAGRLEATGRWAAAAAAESGDAAPGRPARSMTLDFGLGIGDAGRLLGALGFPDLVRGGSGDFTGGVTWQGSPLAIDLPSLTGELRLDIGRGQFLRTEPGIAKLIGVLNLQSLPRRLNFDFRDVFAEGFAFDEIQGGAALLRGVARTEDLAMKGLQAHVNLRGEVDLVRETQSLLVSIQPQVDAGLASLAYAAMVNPAVGIGSFIAQWVLSKPLSDMLATEFEVEGDWRDPQVSQRMREPVTPFVPEEPILQ